MNYDSLYNRLGAGTLLGPVLDDKERSGVEAILKKAEERGLKVADVAYILATVYHETNGKMQPIKEMGGNGYFTRMYDIMGSRRKLAIANGNVHPGDGAKFFGRGLVQITWRGNYGRIGKLIGVDLENNPDKALELPIAVVIAVDGMINGWFTGRKLSKTLPRSGMATRDNFRNSRPIINGMDRADKIAGYALLFQDDLKLAGWSV